MTLTAVLLPALLAFALSAVCTWWLSLPGAPFTVLDHPTHRSLHTTPVPRTGGLAICAGFAAGAALAVVRSGAPAHLAWIAAGAAMVAAISFWDDRKKLSVRIRLPVHLAAGACLIVGGLSVAGLEIFPGAWRLGLAAGAAFTLLYAVWMLNLYNFMDGMDGNAGGMALFGFGTFAVLGMRGGDPLFAAVAGCVAASAAGFLLFNFSPARIFMGDVGSSTLGFLAAALSLWGAHAGLFPLWAAVLVFSPFVVDATFTLVRRAARRERVWEAHRGHYYQRLVQLGLGHRGTALWEYALMLAVAATAVASVDAETGTQRLVVAFWAAAYVALAWLVARLEASARRRRGAPAGRPEGNALDASASSPYNV